MTKSLTPEKAIQMLHDEKAHGKKLTNKQKNYFGAVASGINKYLEGGALNTYNENIDYVPNIKQGIVPDDRLRTFDFGSLEGQKQTREKDSLIHNNIINNPDTPMAGEYGGETFNEAHGRVLEIMKDIINNAPAGTVVMTHNSVYGDIYNWNKHGRPEELSKEQRISYVKQDGNFKPGDHFTIKGNNGDIVISRHGETRDNKHHNFRSADTDLTRNGLIQADNLGKKLKGVDVPFIVSSPLDRTIETSNFIMSHQEDKKKAETGGWLEKYENGGGIGLTDKGFDYNSAWGGQFEKGGEISNKKELNVGKKVEVEHKPTLEFIKDYFEKHDKFPTLQDVATSIATDHINDFKNIKDPKSETYYKGLVENHLTDEVDKYSKGGNIPGSGGFLQPNSYKLPRGYATPEHSELAQSIGGEQGEPAYLIPSFKYGWPLQNPLQEYKNTGEYLGGPFKTWQEADKWDKEVRHPYVEKRQPLPSPLKWWGKEFQSGGSLPGTVGFMYARIGSTPSEGKYTKKTTPSAEDGGNFPYTDDVYKSLGIDTSKVKVPMDYLKPLDRLQQLQDNFQSYGELYDKIADVKPIDNTVDTINLTSGRFRGANVPKFIIDDAIDSAEKNNFPVGKLLSLIGRESTFGQDPRFIHKDRVDKTHLVSGWNIDEDYQPYNLERFLADKGVPGMKVEKEKHFYNIYRDNPDTVREYVDTHPELVGQYIKKLSQTKPLEDKNAFDLAIEFIKKKGVKSYNPGDPRYEEMYNKDYETLKQDPGLQSYLKQKGVQFRDGGEMQYYQQGLDWRPKTISKDGHLLPGNVQMKNQEVNLEHLLNFTNFNRTENNRWLDKYK